MSFNLITGRKGSEHVTSTQFRDIIRAIAGPGTYIPNVNEKLEIVQASSSTIQVKSGVLIHHGCVFEIPYGESVTLTLPNDENAYMVRVTWSITNGIESAQIGLVLNDSTYQAGNMQEGDTTDYVDIAMVFRDGANVEIHQEELVTQDVYTATLNMSGITTTNIDDFPPAEGAYVEHIPAGYYIMVGNICFQTATSPTPSPVEQPRNIQIGIVHQLNGGTREYIPQSMQRVFSAKGNFARLQSVAIGYFEAGYYAVCATCSAPIEASCRSDLVIMRIR
jgi:hypothetical protein